MVADRIIKELKDVASNINRGELSGYAAEAAAKVLLVNWEAALLDAYKGRLLSDIEEVVAHLSDFKERARALLPVVNGGFAGIEKDVWGQRLADAGVLLYEVPESGNWGFTGCESDCYADEDEALNAAIQACLDLEGA